MGIGNKNHVRKNIRFNAVSGIYSMQYCRRQIVSQACVSATLELQEPQYTLTFKCDGRHSPSFRIGQSWLAWNISNERSIVY
jgi:hypothetical protein